MALMMLTASTDGSELMVRQRDTLTMVDHNHHTVTIKDRPASSRTTTSTPNLTKKTHAHITDQQRNCVP